MNKIIKSLVAAFIIMIGIAESVHAATNESVQVEESLVRVIVTYQEYNPQFPWQKERMGTRYGYGVVIDQGKIITTEDLVRNNTLVEIKKVRTGEKITSQVIASDYQVNLALLGFEDQGTKTDLKPVPLAPELKNGDEPNIYQFDANQQIQKGSGSVLETTMDRLPKAPYQTLIFRILSELNVNASGAAVLTDKGLAGLSMRYDRTRRIAEVIPISTIRQFIDDAITPPYSGFASAGFIWRPLIDPAKRRFLNVKEEKQGVVLLSCIPGTDSMKKLKPDDVIVEWDNHPIDNLGYYTDEKLGRIEFSYLIKGEKRPGDIVPIKIIRNKKEMMVKLSLCHLKESSSLIPENTTNKQEEYLLNGGFIFREATGRYLRSFGRNWQQRLNPRLARLYFSGKPSGEKLNERVVIISDILTDPINIGYSRFTFRNTIVTAVNNQPVSNMQDVFRIIDTDKAITRISLKSIDVDIALDKELLDASNKRLMQAYNIPALRYQASSARNSD